MRATTTRLFRKFDIVPEVYLDAKGKVKTRYIFNPREEAIPAQLRGEVTCFVCRGPMVAAAGQIAFYHAACRGDRDLKRKPVVHTSPVDK